MKLGLPLCRQTLYHLSHQGSPKLEKILLILSPTFQKDVSIEELKSTILEYGSIIEVYHNNLTTCMVGILNGNVNVPGE